MSWYSYFPTKIFFGAHAIADHYEVLQDMGKKALIVTGQGNLAQQVGALDDAGQALKQLGIDWEVFDQVESNPSITTVRKGADLAGNCGADFLIGIGGGSAIDSAKAIAILTVNGIGDDALFNGSFKKTLPVVAVPTTAGTGAEATPYAMLNNPEQKAKSRINSPLVIPQIAFLDPLYTLNLPCRVTWDTGVDAYSHALESYLCVTSTPITESLCLEAMGILGPELIKMAENTKTFTWKTREAMLYGSLLGGMAISITGTSIMHAMGFTLTYLKDVPHGRANGLIMPAYMRFNMSRGSHPKIEKALSVSGFDDLNRMYRVMRVLCGEPPCCSQEERELILQQTLQAKNIYHNIVRPEPEDIKQLLDAILDEG